MPDSYTTTVTEQVLEHDFEDLERPVAEQIAATTHDAIAGIKQTVSPATAAWREKAKRAYERGAPWALERYGDSPPDTSNRMFNDSGELAGVRLEPTRGPDGWAITVPDRLSPESRTASGRSDLVDKLAELAPAIADPTIDTRVSDAMDLATDQMIRVR